MRRTVQPYTIDGLAKRLRDMERQIADLQRVRNPPTTYDEVVAGGPFASGAAHLLTMSATSDSIASGGDHVVFSSILAQQGFEGVGSAGSSWSHPVSGVYVLSYEHEWESSSNGGTIELELDGTVPPDGRIATGAVGQAGRGVIAYAAAAGAVGRIKVTQTSGVAQDCDAVVRVAITDPTISVIEGSLPFLITEEVPQRAATTGETFVERTVEITWDGTGTLVLAESSAGTGAIMVDDRLELFVSHADGSSSSFSHDFSPGAGVWPTPAGPIDVTSHFEPGANSIVVRLKDLYGVQVESTEIWLAVV